MTRIVAVEIGGPVEPWDSIGLRIVDGLAVVGSVGMRFLGGEAGMRRVHVDDPDGSIANSGSMLPVGRSKGSDDSDHSDGSDPSVDSDRSATSRFEIDGAPWAVAAASGSAQEVLAHPVGAVRIDHFVLMTPDLMRTCGAIESRMGVPLKRVRDGGNGVQQGFFRFGEVIVEVVESPQVPAGGAAWWGLVLIVDDLDEVANRIGADVISLPRPAVQPGRFIASIRNSVGLGMPVALMSP